ncbi:type I 3-dehydroquinate dehydratase [Halorubellus sp. JP-L1]|uniref:type I 3-dehydroquinate dehydratase n=1 Tax=Halorubellus sp. JP-L1 TaxID=2715753 RepID=UPI00140E6609|nr:type I 3-dehydroquinate dehydratase [Halorubellus sp. JP-L1]NHN42427.1 type I 3-dehydroquinate dehydratase [Halorubellus sp. JP-L1]
MDFESFVLCAATDDLADAASAVAREHADAIEYRMDAVDAAADAGAVSPSVTALAEYDGDLPVVATNRAAWEGGEAAPDVPPSEQDAVDETRARNRLESLAAAASVDAVAAVDVELASLAAGSPGVDTVLAEARANDVAVIASSHDFERTPSRAAMRETLATGLEHADVAKLAVTAESTRDALDVLAVTSELADEPVATMAMGAVGRHTRAVAPVYGSKIGYAPVDPERATAPGQYDLATLAGLVADLR